MRYVPQLITALSLLSNSDQRTYKDLTPLKAQQLQLQQHERRGTAMFECGWRYICEAKNIMVCGFSRCICSVSYMNSICSLLIRIHATEQAGRSLPSLNRIFHSLLNMKSFHSGLSGFFYLMLWYFALLSLNNSLSNRRITSCRPT